MRPACARPVTSDPEGRVTCAAPRPNLARTLRASLSVVPLAATNASTRLPEPVNCAARLIDLTDHHAGPEPLRAVVERQASEQRGEERGLARAVGSDDADLLAPPDLDRHRPESEGTALHHRTVEPRDHRTRAARWPP